MDWHTFQQRDMPTFTVLDASAIEMVEDDDESEPVYEEAAAMLPEHGPDGFDVCLRNVQTRDRRAREEFKTPLAHRRRQLRETRLHLEEKHQPVRRALVAVFADEAGEMQTPRRELQADLLVCFTASTGVGRFAGVRLEFAAGRAPEAAVRLLRAFEQEDFIALIETVEQRRNLVRQRHARSEAGDGMAGKVQLTCRRNTASPPCG